MEPSLVQELDRYSKLPLECDGLTRVLSYILKRKKVRHRIMVGLLLLDGNPVVPVHWWIELQDKRIIDYRARMWAGNRSEIPHGVFNPGDFLRVRYAGRPRRVDIPTCIFEILTTLLLDERKSAGSA